MLVLASASPRRRELIERLHQPFVCMESGFDEETVKNSAASAEMLPMLLADGKAAAAARKWAEDRQENAIVIGADTVVICDGQTLGKPQNEEDAARMLRLLSGRTHQVVTGVSIRRVIAEQSAAKETSEGQETTEKSHAASVRNGICFSVTTDVVFYDLTEEEIQAYIKTGEPMDKAGAYGIQGDGALLVKEIHGDFYNVMGLPISALARKLQDLVIRL